MRLVIDLNLDRLTNDRAKEAVRILRYWAGWRKWTLLGPPSKR